MQQQPQQQTGGLFSGLGQSTQQKPSFLGGLQINQQPPQSQLAFAQSTAQQQQQPTLQLGQSQQNQLGQSQGPPSLWEEGRGLGGQQVAHIVRYLLIFARQSIERYPRR